MNFGYAASGFLDGLERGYAMRDRKKQRELQKERDAFDMEQRLTQQALAREALAFQRAQATQAATDRETDRGYRAGRDQVLDERWAATLEKEKREFDAREAAAAAERSRLMQGQIMGQLQSGIDAYRARPREQAETERIMAQAEALRAKSAALAGGTEQPAGDPMAAAYQGAIDAEKKKIAAHQLEMAGGDNRTGFLNWKSRQSEIDDATAKIAKLQGLLGPDAAAPAPDRMSTMPAGIQQQFQQSQQPPPAVPPPANPMAMPAPQRAPVSAAAPWASNAPSPFTMQPRAPAPTAAAPASPDTQRMLAWAKANPNDPRAAAILQKLGAR